MKLSTRITLLVTIISVFVGAMAVYFVSQAENQRMETEGLVRAQTLNQTAYEALYAVMRAGGSREENRRTIERLNQIPDIHEARVIHGPAVDRQFGVEPDELPQDQLDQMALEGILVQETIRQDGTWLVRFVTPLVVTAECQQCHQAALGDVNGAISVSVSLASVDLERTEHRNLLIVSSLVSISLVGAVILYGSRRWIVRPLRELQAGVVAVARGDLDFHISDPGREDEIAQLTRAFNKMTKALDNSFTDLQQKAKKLEEQHQKLLTAQRVARMGFLDWNLNSGKILLSPEILRLFGFSSETQEITLDILKDAIHPDDLQRVEEGLSRAVAGKMDYDLDHRIIRTDGEVLWIHAQAELFRDPAGQPAQLLGTLIDITELHQTSDALQELNAELEARITDRIAELEIRNALVEAVSSSLELDHIYQKFFDQLHAYLSFDRCSIVTFDHHTRTFKVRAMVSREHSTIGQGYEDEFLPVIEALIAGKTVHIDSDLSLIKNTDQVVNALVGEGTRSRLLVPIIHSNEVIGALNFGSNARKAFSAKDGERMQPIAAQLGIALENARLYEKEKKRAKYFALMNEIGKDLQTNLQVAELLSEAANAVWRRFGYYNVGILLRDAEGKRFISKGIAGVSGDLIPANPGIREGEGILGLVAKTGQPYLSNDIDKDSNYIHLPGLKTQAELCVPIMSGDEIVGILNVESETKNAFDDLDVQAMSLLADQLAVGINNARLYQQTIQLAITDELTSLYNRRYFFETGEKEFQRARRYDRPISLILFDLDHFKKVNDTYGHPVGDQVLSAVAARFRTIVRTTDTFARYGGEEFAVLMPETDIHQAEIIAHRLRTSVENLPIPTTAAPVSITISLGVGQIGSSFTRFGDLVTCSDQALYAAKQQGRNRVVCCDQL